MASLPARQASQRRASPEQSSQSSSAPTSSSQRPRSQSRARSTISEDSQTVLLNSPSPIESIKAEQAAPASLPRPRPQDEPDVKKCWICFSDETEDTPQTSQWRSPCPCALVAHEECLLDWIADLESPSSRKRTLSQSTVADTDTEYESTATSDSPSRNKRLRRQRRRGLDVGFQSHAADSPTTSSPMPFDKDVDSALEDYYADQDHMDID